MSSQGWALKYRAMIELIVVQTRVCRMWYVSTYWLNGWLYSLLVEWLVISLENPNKYQTILLVKTSYVDLGTMYFCWLYSWLYTMFSVNV